MAQREREILEHAVHSVAEQAVKADAEAGEPVAVALREPCGSHRAAPCRTGEARDAGSREGGEGAQRARGTRLYVPLAILASTGLRRGELLALRWRDVELDRRVDGESAPLLRVTASLQRIDGQDVFLPPKTDRARRTVGLPPAAVALLRRHRREQLERRILLGEAWTDLDLVIERGDGEPFPPDSLSRD